MSERHDERRRELRALLAKQIAEMSGAEDAALTAAASRDPDNPPAGNRPASRLKPATEAFPEAVADWERRQRSVREPETTRSAVKRPIFLRLDPDIVEHFKAQGPGWQGRINAALRKAAKLPPKPAAPRRRKAG